jgi:photosystem II stability/assembly factor-like uncharacterized protein
MRTSIAFLLVCLSPAALSQQFDPWVMQATGVPTRHAGCMMHAVDSTTFWSVFEAWGESSQEFARTTDGGATWLCDTIRPASSRYKAVSIYAFDANRAWVLMWDRFGIWYGGLFGTTDGGATWKEDPTVFKVETGAPDFVHFFDAENGVCVGDGQGDLFVVYTTSDGGATWSQIPRENIPPKVANEGGKTHVFTAAGNSLWFPTMGANRFYRTTDRGLTWSVSNFPKASFWYYSTIAFQDEKVGLCNTGWGDVEKTTDGGANWTALPTTVNLAFQDLQYVPHTQGMYVASAAWSCSSLVQPWQAGTLYTLDGGVSWAIATASPVGAVPDNLTLPVLEFAGPASGWQGDMSSTIYRWRVPSGNIVDVHPDSAVFSMVEAGSSSGTVSVDLVNHGSDPVILSSIIAPGARFTVTKHPTLPMTLSSLDWARVELCFTPDASGAYADSLVFASSASNAPRASVHLSGQGVTTKPADSGAIYAAAKLLYAVDPVTGTPSAIGSLQGRTITSLTIDPATRYLHGSTTGTATTLYRMCCATGWAKPVQIFSVGSMMTVAFNPRGELYGGKGGRLYRLDVATGDTVGIGTAPGVSYLSIAFNPGGTLWASVLSSPSGKDAIYKVNTETGEATLVGRTGDGQNIPSIFFDSQGAMYGLKGIGAETNTIISIDTLTGTAAALFSTGLAGIRAMTMMSTPITGVSTEEEPLVFSLEQNYPNPFNPGTSIRYSLPQRAHVELVVFNTLGQRVAMLVREEQEPGHHEVPFEASGLASGVYLYRLTAGDFVHTKKLLLLR